MDRIAELERELHMLRNKEIGRMEPKYEPSEKMMAQCNQEPCRENAKGFLYSTAKRLEEAANALFALASSLPDNMTQEADEALYVMVCSKWNQALHH